MKLLDYLREKGVDFTVKHHDEFYTAQEEAAAQHISGHIFAKTVVVKAGDEYALLVLPASYRVDLDRASEVLGAKAHLATEQEMSELFPDCDVGAEPPFGSRYGLRTVVDAHLAQQERIAARACSHTQLVFLAYADYERLEHPEVASFAQPED
ncbi:MAG: aminoacyl-tRNA deacylase [Armatimonadota bacterium]